MILFFAVLGSLGNIADNAFPGTVRLSVSVGH